MTLKRLLKALILCPMLLFAALVSQAQTKTVTGKVLDEKGNSVTGASVVVKGGKGGTTTDATGTFKLSVPTDAKALTVSFVGYTSRDVDISATADVSVSLSPDNSSLTDVVVIGYGTAKRKDLSGSYSTVTSRNFNKVPATTPDQLLQGKVPGLQVTVASGAPGAVSQVRIRGNNSIRAGTDPLYVVDGVPLDGRSARPGFASVSGLGVIPDSNPLTYLNPNDIDNIAVLKDASASAIYGSRGANGVIQITTKTGTTGPARFDINTSWGYSSLMTQPDVLDVSQYRQALSQYNAHSDSGASINPFDAIIQNKLSQNYSIAYNGGGTEHSRFRASFFASTLPGLIDKSQLDKYIGNINGSYKFLEDKLTLKFGMTVANTKEQIAPISNDPGSTGNLVSLAMQWNPTLLLKRSETQYTVNPNGQVNPLLLSKAYNDYAVVTTMLGNMSAGYKILPELEYQFFYGVNYSTGNRGQELQGYITGTGGNADGKGLANTGTAQLFSQTITHTLTYTKEFKNNLSLTALAGYEYYSTKYTSQSTSVYQFDYNLNLNNLIPIHYYDNMQDGKQSNLTTSSSNDPTSELQSYFGRVLLSYKNKYSLSASIRSDGSTKFGSNNRYAYFPAVSGKWSISNEDFMKNSSVFSNLALRVGWGKTGNQSFPSGASQDRYKYNSNGSLGVVNFANPDLKWETVTSTDAGIDFGFLNNRITGTIDVFFKKTTDPLFPGTLAAPAPAGVLWQNLPGYVENKGGEIGVNWQIIQNKNFAWSINPTATYVKNKFVFPGAGEGPLVLTGNLNGKGTSATWVQAIANDQPIDVFYLRKFHGFDKDGFAITDNAASYAGDPNPKWVVGITTELDYKKLSLIVNMHGAYDFFIYNNTVQSVTGLSFITNGSNISKTLIGTPENIANPVSASTRFMTKGNYMKLGNATVNYKVGDVGKMIKNLNVYFTGVNLFELTKYPGFDPEVNVSKSDINNTGIPSIGIDYVGYPTPRSFFFGLSLSLGN